MENRIEKKEEVNIALIPYFTNIPKEYKLTATERILYGFFWNFLSKNRNKQMTVKSEDISDILSISIDTVNSGVKKLASLNIINYKTVSNKQEGGKIRFVSWNEQISYKIPEKIEETKEKNRVDRKNLITGGNKENPISLYNNISNISNISNKDITKQDNKYISDIIKILSSEPEKNRLPIKSSIKMSSITLTDEIIKKKQRRLNEEELELFKIYNSHIKGNFSEYSDTVVDGVSRCLKLFKDIYKEKAVERFKEAMHLFLSSKDWRYQLSQDVLVGQPKKFFNQTRMENWLITQLDNEVVSEKKDDFSKDLDVIKMYQKNAEYLKQLREKVK